MTTQLKLYNAALLEIGERRLVALTDDVEARHTLDEVWQSGDLVNYLLQQGYWNFASRTIELTYNPSIEPPFGYKRAFDKPSDIVRTAMLCRDAYFRYPERRYEDEAAYWFADVDTLYVQYISNDSAYGNDMSLWTPAFVRWVEVYLASRVCERLTQNSSKAKDLREAADPASKRPTLLIDARSKDAMDEAAMIPNRGSWTLSRRQGDRANRDGGNYSSLIG